MSIDSINKASKEIKSNEKVKKTPPGVLLVGVYLLLISSIFLIMQIILAFKLHWSFIDFQSTLKIVRWWVSIAASGIFILGSISLFRKKRHGWWISILYSGLIVIGSIIVMYNYIRVFKLSIETDDFFPPFIGILLGCLNAIYILINRMHFSIKDSNQLTLRLLGPHIVSGIIIFVISILISSNQLNDLMRTGLHGDHGLISILFMLSKWIVLFGALGIVIWGSSGIIKRKLWKWWLGALSSGIILIGSIGVIFFGLNIFELSLGAYIDWGRIISSLIGIVSGGYVFQYLFRKKDLFS
jgi:hypothetical protein